MSKQVSFKNLINFQNEKLPTRNRSTSKSRISDVSKSFQQAQPLQENKRVPQINHQRHKSTLDNRASEVGETYAPLLNYGQSSSEQTQLFEKVYQEKLKLQKLEGSLLKMHKTADALLEKSKDYDGNDLNALLEGRVTQMHQQMGHKIMDFAAVQREIVDRIQNALTTNHNWEDAQFRGSMPSADLNQQKIAMSRLDLSEFQQRLNKFQRVLSKF